MVGKSVRVIVISSLEGGQMPFEIVHRKVFIPTLNPVTLEVGEAGEVIVALPVTTTHVPVPTIAVFPERIALVLQTA